MLLYRGKIHVVVSCRNYERLPSLYIEGKYTLRVSCGYCGKLTSLFVIGRQAFACMGTTLTLGLRELGYDTGAVRF